jgi:hypothetical protein
MVNFLDKYSWYGLDCGGCLLTSSLLVFISHCYIWWTPFCFFFTFRQIFLGTLLVKFGIKPSILRYSLWFFFYLFLGGFSLNLLIGFVLIELGFKTFFFLVSFNLLYCLFNSFLLFKGFFVLLGGFDVHVLFLFCVR